MINALRELGFERYCENLENYRQKYESVKKLHEDCKTTNVGSEVAEEEDGDGDADLDGEIVNKDLDNVGK